MVDKMSLTVYKCPMCGGDCKQYEDELYLCTSCGQLCEKPVEKKVVEIRNRAKIERIRFEIQQYNDKMAEKEKEEAFLHAYARMSWFERVKFNISMMFDDLRDLCLIYPARTFFVIIAIIAAIIAAFVFIW